MATMARMVLFLTLSMALAGTCAALASAGKEEALVSRGGEVEPSSLRGPSRSLGGQYSPTRTPMTCHEFPRVCRAKGSPGPDCCRRQCVNVMTDSLNCGSCGTRCRYGQACCRGRCVNVMFDGKNCGSCWNRCKKGDFCKYGICSYA